MAEVFWVSSSSAEYSNILSFLLTVRCLTFGINDVQVFFLLICCGCFHRTQNSFILRAANLSVLSACFILLSPALFPSLGTLFHLLHPFMHDFGLGRSDKCCLLFITQLLCCSDSRNCCSSQSRFIRSSESIIRSTFSFPALLH